MSKLNLLVFLNAYADAASSNNPSQNHFKWTRNINGINVENPIESTLSLAPGESRTIFNGARTLLQDGTTHYSIALKPLATSEYVLSYASGTSPNFRTPRSTGADGSTAITVSQNGTVTTFTSSAGTPLNLTGSQVGDEVVIGSNFNALNQGQFSIISLTTTSFSVVNPNAVAETVVLGAGFASQLQIFSAAGVQPGDTLVISSGFSPVTQGSYVVKTVQANTLTFSSTAVLPQESAKLTQVTVYESAKRLVYIESDANCGININAVAAGSVEPLISCNKVIPGLYLKTGLVWALVITNNSEQTANLFMVAAE